MRTKIIVGFDRGYRRHPVDEFSGQVVAEPRGQDTGCRTPQPHGVATESGPHQRLPGARRGAAQHREHGFDNAVADAFRTPPEDLGSRAASDPIEREHCAGESGSATSARTAATIPAADEVSFAK